LRGLKYATWEDESKVFPVEGEEGGAANLPHSSLAHKKFQNYRFQADEFLRIMARLETEVKNDPLYSTALEIGLRSKDEL
jgi:hypothetical protein